MVTIALPYCKALSAGRDNWIPACAGMTSPTLRHPRAGGDPILLVIAPAKAGASVSRVIPSRARNLAVKARSLADARDDTAGQVAGYDAPGRRRPVRLACRAW